LLIFHITVIPAAPNSHLAELSGFFELSGIHPPSIEIIRKQSNLFAGAVDLAFASASPRVLMANVKSKTTLVWRFRSPHHCCHEPIMPTPEPKPH
jgi:hypothetical protein